MSTETAPRPARSGASLWVRILLAVSVGLNLLIFGAAVGFAWKHWHRFDRGGVISDMPRPIVRFVRSLPEEKRVPFRAAMRERRAALRPLQQEMRAARRNLRDVLEAETFNMQAFDAAQARFIQALTAIRQKSLSFVPGLAEGLTQDERVRFGRALNRVAPGRRGHRHFRKRDRDFAQD
ncbi:MAG: periplasmic heavy metal sensor [Pseudomonadota bacterium]